MNTMFTHLLELSSKNDKPMLWDLIQDPQEAKRIRLEFEDALKNKIFPQTSYFSIKGSASKLRLTIVNFDLVLSKVPYFIAFAGPA